VANGASVVPSLQPLVAARQAPSCIRLIRGNRRRDLRAMVGTDSAGAKFQFSVGTQDGAA
jgi:hypothetical protein